MSAEEARLRANPKMAAFLKSEPFFRLRLKSLTSERTRVMVLRSVTEALAAVSKEKQL